MDIFFYDSCSGIRRGARDGAEQCIFVTEPILPLHLMPLRVHLFLCSPHLDDGRLGGEIIQLDAPRCQPQEAIVWIFDITPGDCRVKAQRFWCVA